MKNPMLGKYEGKIIVTKLYGYIPVIISKLNLASQRNWKTFLFLQNCGFALNNLVFQFRLRKCIKLSSRNYKTRTYLQLFDSFLYFLTTHCSEN